MIGNGIYAIRVQICGPSYQRLAFPVRGEGRGASVSAGPKKMSGHYFSWVGILRVRNMGTANARFLTNGRLAETFEMCPTYSHR